MAKIISLYDAIIKTIKPEDKCTNFLLWLLEKLPSKIILDICKISDLSISQVKNNVSISVQYPLKNSRADGLVEFSDGKYLIIETKRFPNSFDKEQFLNHFNGGGNEFGEENIWLLFLSGDEHIPSELNELKKRYYGKIGFISWKSLLQFFRDNVELLGKKYEIVTKEFIAFANRYNLGRLISMNNEEIKKFIEVYPIVAIYQEAVLERFSEILNKIKDRIIMECEELVKENEDDTQEKLPCLYRALNIDGWHIEKSSGYVFVDILQRNIGIVLTGYQDKNEKAKFQPHWSENYRNKYKNDTNLRSLTWVSQGEDQYAVKGGYFKMVEGTSGKLFNPAQIPEFTDYFYFGYVPKLEIEKMQSYSETIVKDFKRLMDVFRKRKI